MKGNTVMQLFYFSLFVALAFGPSATSGLWPGRKRFVRIVNNLGNNQQLTYHCWSQDDDLGVRYLPPNQEWEWKFHLDFESVWDCDFSFSNYHAHKINVFFPSDKFIGRCGGAHCIWKAEDQGLSLFHIKGNFWEKVYDWQT
ncbi:hypothetical protein ACFX13_037067 [Malus domestica]